MVQVRHPSAIMDGEEAYVLSTVAWLHLNHMPSTSKTIYPPEA